MARTRMKCLFLLLTSIILYVVGSFICLHIHHYHNELKISSGKDDSLVTTDLLRLTQTGSVTRVKQVFEVHGDEWKKNEFVIADESQNSPDIETKHIELTNMEGNLSPRLPGSRRKFLFVFRYYEQLGRATSNLLDLASFAKSKNRVLVVPYVNNSRMSGLSSGVSHNFHKPENPPHITYSLLSEYFNLDDLNSKLESRGYSTMRSFRDLESHCDKRFNIVVHFLFHDENYQRVTALWYRITEEKVATTYKEARERNGWVDCPFIKHSRLSKQIQFKVRRYICVDPEVIRTASDLEDNVLQGAKCVGIVQWRGNGPERVHFPLDPSITQPLRPVDLEFNSDLVELAKKFVRENLNEGFIGVHVRSERHIARKGANVTKRCMEKLANRVQTLRDALSINKVYLASDLTDYGSDTLMNFAGTKYRRSLSAYLREVLSKPVMFNPNGVLYDSGATAIVEMNILAMATRLFTLGGGNFQEWMVGLFLRKHNHQQTRIHRICELKG